MKKYLFEKGNEGKSLFNSIRNIVREKFKVHGNIIKELIKSNLKTVNECFDQLSSYISYLTAVLGFILKKTDEKLVQVKKEIKDSKPARNFIEHGLLNAIEVSAKLITLKDRFRKNNFRIDKINVNPNERDVKAQSIIIHKLGINSDVEVDRCYRIES